jgi:hypothetical protein
MTGKKNKFLFIVTLLFLVVSSYNCNRVRYTGFNISEISIKTGLEDITVPNLYYIKVEGPEINDESDRVMVYPPFSEATFYTSFSAKKEQKKYTFKVMKEVSTGEVEVYSFSFKLNEFEGQRNFVYEPGDGYKFRFTVDWPSMW